MIRKASIIIVVLLLFSCVSHRNKSEGDVITVSIAPFGFFVEAIADGDFTVNVMVPAGSDPHMYEPSPGQVSGLRKSRAYISNKYLDFEITWLDRFFSVNPAMVRLNLADSIGLLSRDDEHSAADPHFWLSPVEALKIAEMTKNMLCRLNPDSCVKYSTNYTILTDSIKKIHYRAEELFKPFEGKPVIVFHHTLGYFARDYNLNQISIEQEGKEPSPSWLKYVINVIKENGIKTIIVQKEFDTRSAEVIASETGAELKYIETLSADWFGSVNEIIDVVYNSFNIHGGSK